MRMRILIRAVLLAFAMVAAAVGVGFVLAVVVDSVFMHPTFYLISLGIILFAALVVAIMIEASNDSHYVDYGDRGPDG